MDSQRFAATLYNYDFNPYETYDYDALNPPETFDDTTIATTHAYGPAAQPSHKPPGRTSTYLPRHGKPLPPAHPYDYSPTHYNRFRYYDPSVGRYLNADPIGQAGGVNVYGYALGNPIYWVDPLGLDGVVFGGSFGVTGILGFGSATGSVTFLFELPIPGTPYTGFGFGAFVSGGAMESWTREPFEFMDEDCQFAAGALLNFGPELVVGAAQNGLGDFLGSGQEIIGGAGLIGGPGGSSTATISGNGRSVTVSGGQFGTSWGAGVTRVNTTTHGFVANSKSGFQVQ